MVSGAQSYYASRAFQLRYTVPPCELVSLLFFAIKGVIVVFLA